MTKQAPDVVFCEASQLLLSADALPGQLYDAAHRLFDLLSNIVGYDDNSPSGEQSADTILNSGKAIAFQGAARCLWEFARTSKFLRGVEAALRAAQARFPGERLRLLEAGCGPFALLALPMATRFRADEVGFTLLDIHPNSLEAARRIVNALGLEAYVDAYVCADASTWRCAEDVRPHVIVSETMQNALKNEPQIAITRNLAPQGLPGGFFLPESISLDFSLLTWHSEGSAEPRQCSKRMASLFAVSADCCDDAQMRGSFVLPEILPAHGRPAICTRIRIFGDIELGENECSLTMPLRIKDLPALRGGEEVSYHYAWIPRPGVQIALGGAG